MIRWLAFALALPAAALAQAPERRAFALIGPGDDTVAVERWLRWGSRTESLITRDGEAWFHLVADIDPESATERLALTSYDPSPDGRSGLSFSHEIVIRGTTATVRDAITGIQTSQLEVPVGTVPIFPASLALLERQLLTRPELRRHAQDLVQLPALAVGPTGARVDTLRFVASLGQPDSIWSHLTWHDLLVAHASDGRVLGARSMDAAEPLVFTDLGPAFAAAAWPARPQNYAPDRTASSKALEVAIVRSEVTLGGTFLLPTAVPGRAPAMLLLSGSGAQDRDGTIMSGYRPMREIAEALAEAGIATLRLDDRGVGESSGAYASATIADLAEDARAAIDWLARQPEVDPARVGIVGHSEGALVAMQAVADGAPVHALALLSASASLGRVILAAQQHYGAARLVRDSTPAIRDSLVAALATDAARALDVLASESSALRYFLEYEPGKVARRLDVPALVMHGSTDRQVDVTEADRLSRALRRRGASVSVQLLGGVNHLLLDDPVGDPALYLTLPSRRLNVDAVRGIVGWVRATLQE